MQFPLRLTADLTMAIIAERLGGTAVPPLALRLSPGEEVGRSNRNPGKPFRKTRTEDEILACVRDCPTQLVWIGGPEPLLYPGIGHLTRRIVDCGRHVFLETSGTLLRGRIHSFRPVSRLFLTVNLNGMESAHDHRAGTPQVFQAAVEGIRAAKLSGFFVCVQTVVYADTEFHDLERLSEFLHALDVEGWIVSPGADSACSKQARSKLSEARKLIGNWRWRLFSRLFDSRSNSRSVQAPGAALEEQAACEEGVGIP
jgi:molybdenum cofactor biosynthesis enzyme MoaA